MSSETNDKNNLDMIPLHVPEIRGNEWKYIKECLDTNWVSSVGPFVDRFENEVARYLGVKHAVATLNCTAALHTALLVSGVKPDDEVLTSTLTFIASANSIRYVGAWPVFIDAEPQYWQMDPQKVIDFLKKNCRWAKSELRNKETGRRVSAVMPVHILGHPVDVDPILETAHKYNLMVIEDAAEAIGAKYKDRMVGSLSDIGCLSFNGNKIITTGGGGMIVTNNEKWAEQARHLTTQAKADSLEYIHDEVGYNYRLTNLQAAMGCAQLEQLEGFIDIKRGITERYDEAFIDIRGITPMKHASWAESNYWLYTCMVDKEIFGMDSRTLLRKLMDEGIQARPLWQPLHLSRPFKNFFSHDCDVAEYLFIKGISLPCSASLSIQQQLKVIKHILANR